MISKDSVYPIMKYFFLFSFSILSDCIYAQLPFGYGSSLKWYHHYFFNQVFYDCAIDTLNGDTIKVTKTDYFRINSFGDTIEHLEYDDKISSWYCNDDGYYLTGRFIKWYPDKTQAEIGNYVCNNKVDEWLYFYPNGSIMRYENYFRTELQEYSQLKGTRSGLYKEYYENGQVKISGNYKIVMQFLPYALFNSDTYEDEYKCCEWVLTSVKDGTWMEYNKNGKRISKKRYYTDTDKLKNVQDISDMMSFSQQNEIGLDTLQNGIYLNFKKHK